MAFDIYALLDPLTRLTFVQLQAIFNNVSFSKPITDIQLSDKEPRCVLLEFDDVPTLTGLDGYTEGPLRREGMRVFQSWVVVPATIEQWLEDSTRILNAKSPQAGAQISALNTRIAGINWAISGQDPDDDDYEPATPAEIAELPIRTAQLTKWNSYNRKLGQVNTQATWPVDPVWPVMPEPYTNEMSLMAKSPDPVA